MLLSTLVISCHAASGESPPLLSSVDASGTKPSIVAAAAAGWKGEEEEREGGETNSEREREGGAFKGLA